MNLPFSLKSCHLAFHCLAVPLIGGATSIVLTEISIILRMSWMISSDIRPPRSEALFGCAG